MIVAIIILIIVSLISGFIGSIVVTQSKLKKRIECIEDLEDIIENKIILWDTVFKKQHEQHEQHYRILSVQVDDIEKAIVDIEKSIAALDTQIDQIEEANK